mmetsp:Transcript_44649/g.112521  ORF Transcript_44649/g.112521 Transcript_44649/m.112521 type:complete len:375 (-) Transcript_44649:1844-2968(-)|eukprot:CAMPEP_0174238266 /NCGR_PEP_ID=MMETSP0417-20130205/10732_1 /TAXON_ID=242541 /ORGANISM="Mayorella sp, Strain BSH-02190019" /LENGTH=374 /DNA_ID=CAMNT_0015317085 /DNA_START=27 /DNA_END=1151 /DNA_ORIENTATION=+
MRAALTVLAVLLACTAFISVNYRLPSSEFAARRGDAPASFSRSQASSAAASSTSLVEVYSNGRNTLLGHVIVPSGDEPKDWAHFVRKLMVFVMNIPLSSIHVYTFDGVEITSLPQLRSELSIMNKIYLVPNEDHFVYPGLYSGFKFNHRELLNNKGEPLTVETLALSPKLMLMDDFLSMEECDHIIARARPKLFKSKTYAGTGKQDEYSDTRKSEQAWLKHEYDDIIRNVTQRMTTLAKIPLVLGEDMQVVHYPQGGFYQSHHDYFDPKMYPGGDNAKGKNRILTLLLYLNDVEEGGQTNFPMVNNTDFNYDYSSCEFGVSVFPKKGRAALFYSLYPEDNLVAQLDPNSLHGGCPIIKGEKWLSNVWYSNRDKV